MLPKKVTKMLTRKTPLKGKKKLNKRSKNPYATLRRKAWEVFSEYVRRRDNGTCFTCDKKDDWKNMDAGHYIHIDCLDFNEKNINCQCIRCNHFLSGNGAIYAERLAKKYGWETVLELRELSHQVRKFKRDELEEIIFTYRAKTELKEAIGAGMEIQL